MLTGHLRLAQAAAAARVMDDSGEFLIQAHPSRVVTAGIFSTYSIDGLIFAVKMVSFLENTLADINIKLNKKSKSKKVLFRA